MGRNIVETLMGAFVLFVAAVFIFISYKSGNVATDSNSYRLSAKFREIGSIAVGSDVRVGGVKVGSVYSQTLDKSNYMAVLDLSIKEAIQLPRDSIASIVGDGLLGGKYVAISPGGEEAFLKPGDEIKYTQDAVNIEQLIGKFAFGSVSKDSAAKDIAKTPEVETLKK